MHNPTTRPGCAPSARAARPERLCHAPRVPVPRAPLPRAPLRVRPLAQRTPAERRLARPTQCRSAQRLPVAWLCIVLQYNAKPPTAFRSQYTRLYCDTVLHPPSCLSHNTISCLAIQSVVLQYNFQPSSLLLYNTKIVLQYNFQHPLNLQYTSNFCTIFFFLRFSLYIYIFNYFQQLEKSLKIIIFFHFLEHSNKFLKFILLHFLQFYNL